MADHRRPPALEPPTCDDRSIWDIWLSALHFTALTVADEIALFPFLATSPATEITVAGALACLTDTGHPLMQSVLRKWADRAIAAAAVRPEEAATWLDDVLAPRRPGALLAIPIIVTAGRKPMGGPNP